MSRTTLTICDDCGKVLEVGEDDIISILHFRGKESIKEIRKELCIDCYNQYKRDSERQKAKKLNPWLKHYHKTKGGIADE